MKESLFAVWIVTGLFVLKCFLINECETRSVRITENDIECFSQNKIYHAEKDKCFKLLTQGPCEPGYWFVLEKPKSDASNSELDISAICVEEKCPEGGYYWVKTKTCVESKSKKRLCGNSADEELLNNVFGEGQCMCARDPLRARLNGDENNKCYQLYTKGPCRQGEVLGFLKHNLDRATCIIDKCHEETVKMKKDGKLSRYGVLAPWVNGSCYELGTQGPCPETLKFKVHETTRQPACITLTNAIFDIEKPQSCYQDENGDCQKKINKSESAEKYKEELLSALNSARKKRTIG